MALVLEVPTELPKRLAVIRKEELGGRGVPLPNPSPSEHRRALGLLDPAMPVEGGDELTDPRIEAKTLEHGPALRDPSLYALSNPLGHPHTREALIDGLRTDHGHELLANRPIERGGQIEKEHRPGTLALGLHISPFTEGMRGSNRTSIWASAVLGRKQSNINGSLPLVARHAQESFADMIHENQAPVGANVGGVAALLGPRNNEASTPRSRP